MSQFFKYTIILLLLFNLKSPICDLRGNSTKQKSIEEIIALSTSSWGGSPDLIQKGRSPSESQTKEFYYHRSYAKASEQAVSSGSESKKQTSCSDAASLKGKFEILEIFMDELLKDSKQVEEEGRATVYFDEGNFLTCNFYESQDKKRKSKKCSGEIQSFGTAECWSTKNKYQECGCLVYFKYKGGKNSAFKNLKIKEN